ncbi:hypothetical protein [Bdellovibrio sp. NC01]|uniref:hypothetical protein n=1 Tax=Bdellovibrio sp. NC01 TaxID=2220073 RepID=UPI0011573F29|nr:hypothetical protein [Bdellovibrio sp. NC01]QDK38972.1 hypothetical protein DOE51_15950 [Bdellovibrio sp. NC01]
MKALFLATALAVSGQAHATATDTMAITGKVISLEEKTLTLKTEEGKVQIPKKFAGAKYAVGEVVTIAFPKSEFKNLVIVRTK